MQGLVTYYNASADTGGLCVIPGSHRSHDALCSRATSAKLGIDFVSIDADDPILSGGGVLVCAQAGGLCPTSLTRCILPPPLYSPHTTQRSDLLLWDSRTVHCNTPALSQSEFFSLPIEEQLQQAAAQPRELIRLCSYVCMVPRSHATPEELRMKVNMFANRHETLCLIIFTAFSSLKLPPAPLPALPVRRTPVSPRPTGPHTRAPF